MSLKIKLAPNSPIHLSAEDQKQLLRHQANECAKVANRFEQRAADDKGCPAALPRDMCRAISLSTEAMADYIARKADVWAVEQQIHGAPEDVAYARTRRSTQRRTRASSGTSWSSWARRSRSGTRTPGACASRRGGR